MFSMAVRAIVYTVKILSAKDLKYAMWGKKVTCCGITSDSELGSLEVD